MWIIAPSTPSASAPETEDSITASDWRFQRLEACVWSRGKDTRSRDWFRRWKRAVWLQRLYGAMSKPSEADHGVALWTASLAASRVRPIAWPGRSLAPMTPEISGLTPAASLSSPAPGSSSSRTSGACYRPAQIRSLGQNVSGETYADWVARLRLDSSRRRRSASLRNESACSFSAFTTDVSLSRPNWPTPATRYYKGANSADHMEVSTGSLHLDQLPNFVAHVWSTPTVSAGGYTRDKGRKGSERLTLEGEAETWSTPAVADVQGGRRSRSKARSNELLLNGQADFLSSRLGPTMSTAGEMSPSPLLMLYRRYRATTCSVLRSERRALLLMAIRRRGRGWTRRPGAVRTRPSFRRQLNPTFVFWLMGWKTGSTPCGLLEMGSSLWWQVWRERLLQSERQPAPPQQLTLF